MPILWTTINEEKPTMKPTLKPNYYALSIVELTAFVVAAMFCGAWIGVTLVMAVLR